MRRLILVPILLFSTSLSLGQKVPPIPTEARVAIEKLEQGPYRAQMAFLADDLLEGRGTGR
jgi:hypothetical protein